MKNAEFLALERNIAQLQDFGAAWWRDQEHEPTDDECVDAARAGFVNERDAAIFLEGISLARGERQFELLRTYDARLLAEKRARQET